MKTTRFRILALALCLCLATAPALAVNTAVLPEHGEDDYRCVDEMVTVGDTVYILTTRSSEMQLWRWNRNMAQAELATEWISNARYPDEPEEGMLQFSAIFTDGETLYALNHRESTVYRVIVTDGGVSLEPVVELANIGPMCRDPENPDSFVTPQQTLVVGDKLVWLSTNMQSSSYRTQVLVYDLADGNVKEAVVSNVRAMTVYRDGRVLLLCSTNDKSYTVYAYDPETDATSLLGETGTIGYVDDVAYDPVLDLLLYQDSTRIMGWNPDGTRRQVSFVPATARGELTLAGDSIVYSNGNSVAARTVSADYADGRSLRILNGNMNAVVSQFSTQYMDVPYYYMDSGDEGEDVRTLLAREENRPDLVMLSGVEFAQLRDEGLLMDLSAFDDLVAYADSLYPAFKDLVTQDGAVYGIPTYADSHNGWFINKEVMQAMGLTEADIPTSLTELCAFATRWNDEFVDKYPQYTLLNNTEEYRDRFLNAMLDEWSKLCQSQGKPLTMDDPVVREMLTAWEAMQVDALNANLQQTDPEKSEYKQALIWTDCKVIGNWDTYMEDYSDRIFIPLSLTPDTPYVASVEAVRVWAVNARSENAENAAAMLTERIKAQDTKNARVLQNTETEPVVSEYYERHLEAALEEIERLEASMEDSVNKAAVEQRIAEAQRYIDGEMKQQMYEVTPSAIENYVNVIVPAMYIRLEGWSVSLVDLKAQYADGTLSMEEFIAAVDALLTSEN